MNKIYEIGGIIASVIVGIPVVLLVLLPVAIITMSIFWLLGVGMERFIAWWLGLWGM